MLKNVYVAYFIYIHYGQNFQRCLNKGVSPFPRCAAIEIKGFLLSTFQNQAIVFSCLFSQNGFNKQLWDTGNDIPQDVAGASSLGTFELDYGETFLNGT